MEIAMMTIEVCCVIVFGWCRGEEPGRPGAVVGKNAYDNWSKENDIGRQQFKDSVWEVRVNIEREWHEGGWWLISKRNRKRINVGTARKGLSICGWVLKGCHWSCTDWGKESSVVVMDVSHNIGKRSSYMSILVKDGQILCTYILCYIYSPGRGRRSWEQEEVSQSMSSDLQKYPFWMC